MRERVLLIEDDPLYREALQERLAPFCIMDAVGTLAEGINEALSKSYWCILLDLSLPDSKWSETLKTFSTITRAASIVIITGRDGPGAVAQHILEGASGYLVKGRDDRDGEQMFGAISRAVLHKQSLLNLKQAARIAHDTAQMSRSNHHTP